MYQAVTDFLDWVILAIPDFLMSHPVIEFLAMAMTVWLIALVFRVLRNDF